MVEDSMSSNSNPGHQDDSQNHNDSANQHDSVNLAFVGDVCLGLKMSDILAEHGADSLFKSVSPILKQADLSIGNFEACIVDDSRSDDAHGKMMAVSLETAQALDKSNFDLMNLANNHMLDCGAESIACTREFLSSHGIVVFGAGSNFDEASSIAYVRIKEKVIAFVGFCDSTRYYAGVSKSGIAPMNQELMKSRIEEARKSADLVIVSLHADLEFSFYPAFWRLRFMRWLAEQGAHLVIGHHPHVLQGIETWQGSMIAYSLGNFVFRWHGFEYMEKHEGVADSMILQVEVEFAKTGPKCSWQVVPVIIDREGRPQLADGTDKNRIAQQVIHLSQSLADSRIIRRKWSQFCRREARRHIRSLYWELRDHGIGATLRYLGLLFSTPQERRWIKGLMSFGRW